MSADGATVLLVGATGLVGGHALDRLLADPRIARVIAPVRRPLPHRHARLSAPVVDFEALPDDAALWRVDAVICALGTTIRAAGSRETFRRVDHDYPLAVGAHARRQGARAFALTSAMGADARSRVFYSRVKGELEVALQAQGWPSLTLVRPGLIGGDRDEVRPAERTAARVLGVLGPVLPRRWRISPAPHVADALVDHALAAAPGCRTVDAGALA
ncbi:NAD-dependent dehydratase [Luteimonas sp. 9C]|uniref:NAD(P)H-binding protein n=1 Tax=Luteimonas sp. 9C TaxID=2653148 RepID=UPI0012F29C93|nr:NAD(P)H-binding protein [Luteimonas sp. 9C]VXC02204.1 NAD-dependent dehydratase [Luteimonas sp. 9C]